MISIAILGFGVVGSGIAEVVSQNKEAIRKMTGDEVYVKYILDLRSFPDSPYNDRVVHDISVITGDADVKVVCEAMGGVNPAFDFSMAALRSKKSVVTSNKELVAKKGVELIKTAHENGVEYLFEASAGGGIPEIRSMRTSLSGDTISEIDGILNGTTNYILTRMKKDRAEFSEALSEAQRLGYAEKNPTADVDGFDAQRKIMILTAVATGKMVDESDVYTETMTRITPADMEAAARWDGTVKLLGVSRIHGEHASLYVCPFFVPGSNPLSHIDDVYNGIRVVSPITADVMFYGRGAGRMPTAGAVVSDVVSILSGMASCEKKLDWQNAAENYVTPFKENNFSYYVRVKTDSLGDTMEKAALALGSIEELCGASEGYAEFITPEMKEEEAEIIFNNGSVGEVVSRIRIL